MRNYSYNRDFLGEWMRKEGIKLADVKRVLGLEGSDKIKMWAGQTPLPDVKNDRDDRGWMPLKHILKICNHFDLPLSSFIVNAEEPVTKKIRSARQQATADDRAAESQAIRLELLQTRLDHQREINMLNQQSRQREDDLRREYEEKLAEQKRDYEQRLTSQQDMMQHTIDSQRETIVTLQHSTRYIPTYDSDRSQTVNDPITAHEG